MTKLNKSLIVLLLVLTNAKTVSAARNKNSSLTGQKTDPTVQKLFQVCKKGQAKTVEELYSTLANRLQKPDICLLFNYLIEGFLYHDNIRAQKYVDTAQILFSKATFDECSKALKARAIYNLSPLRTLKNAINRSKKTKPDGHHRIRMFHDILIWLLESKERFSTTVTTGYTLPHVHPEHRRQL